MSFLCKQTDTIVRATMIAALFSMSANAYSLPRKGEVLPDTAAIATMLTPNVGYDFEGITKLSNCSGSLVRFESSKETDKAMVLTNGHCVVPPSGQFIAPNEYLKDLKQSRGFTFLTPSGDFSANSVSSTKILYATMTGTDLALYETNKTFKEIRDSYGVDPLTISSRHPDANDSIEILSGYWRRGYSCKVHSFIHTMKEDAYQWSDSIRYTPECRTIHGTSGSPIIAAGTREVIGINNTGSDDGEECTMNNPCEINEAGQVSYEKGRSYGQQTYIIYSCLNANNQIDLSIKDCKLFH